MIHWLLFSKSAKDVFLSCAFICVSDVLLNVASLSNGLTQFTLITNTHILNLHSLSPSDTHTHTQTESKEAPASFEDQSSASKMVWMINPPLTMITTSSPMTTKKPPKSPLKKLVSVKPDAYFLSQEDNWLPSNTPPFKGDRPHRSN